MEAEGSAGTTFFFQNQLSTSSAGGISGKHFWYFGKKPFKINFVYLTSVWGHIGNEYFSHKRSIFNVI